MKSSIFEFVADLNPAINEEIDLGNRCNKFSGQVARPCDCTVELFMNIIF
jgi:hypothetical protein